MDHRKKFSSLKEDHWNTSSVLSLISSYSGHGLDLGDLDFIMFTQRISTFFSASRRPRDKFLMQFCSEYNNGY